MLLEAGLLRLYPMPATWPLETLSKAPLLDLRAWSFGE
jgi:hypothetical protein